MFYLISLSPKFMATVSEGFYSTLRNNPKGDDSSSMQRNLEKLNILQNAPNINMRSQLCLGLTVVFDRVDLFFFIIIIILFKQVRDPSTLFFGQYTGVKLKLTEVDARQSCDRYVNP